MVKYCLSVLLVVAVGVWGQGEDNKVDSGKYCKNLTPDFQFENVIVTNDCFDREDPDNGVYQPINITSPDGTVTSWYKRRVECKVTCINDSYLLVGRPFTVCRDSDQLDPNAGFKWLPNNQNCTIERGEVNVTCKNKPEEPINGSVSCPADTGPYDVDTVCEFVCDEGFTRHDNQSVCTQTGDTTAEFIVNKTCCIPNCRNGSIVFVMDRSTSVGTVAFDRMKTFAVETISNEAVSGSGLQYGVVVYDHKLEDTMEIRLDNSLTQEELVDKISNYNWVNGEKNTLTAAALSRAGDLIEAAAKGGPHIIVLLTSGVSTDEANVPSTVQELENKNIQLFAVGSVPRGHTGDQDFINDLMRELRAVSSTDAYIIDDANNDALTAVGNKIDEESVVKLCYDECPGNQ